MTSQNTGVARNATPGNSRFCPLVHELSVCSALLDQVERIAREKNALSVSRIVLRLGPLSGIEPRLLQRAYPLAAAGTIAEHAELSIAAAEVVVRCSRCGEESTVPPNRLLCKTCGDFRTHLISGDELLLQSIELTPATSRPAASC